MTFNPNNRRSQYNGAIESKRSRQHRKLHPINPKPRRKRSTYFSRPLCFDSSNILHRMFLRAFGISFEMLTIGDHHDPMCTEYFLYESNMTPEIISNYYEML